MGISILTNDGGGTKALASLMIYNEINSIAKKARKRLPNFDLHAGTSAGGLLALSRVYLRLTPDEQTAFLFEIANKVFKGEDDQRLIAKLTSNNPISESLSCQNDSYDSSLSKVTRLFAAGAIYDKDALEKILNNLFADAKMEVPKDKSTPYVFVVSTATSQKKDRRFIYHNFPDNAEVKNMLGNLQSSGGSVAAAALATALAPVYFNGEKDDNVDGGFMDNDPTKLAIIYSKRLFPNEEIDLIISVGTGQFEKEAGNNYGNLFNSLLRLKDNVTTSDNSDIFGLLGVAKRDNYFRFDPKFSKSHGLSTLKFQDLYEDMFSYFETTEFKEQVNKLIAKLPPIDN